MKLSRRVKASRANGAKSRGPKTPEGKLSSQTHAIRHGMLARCVVLDGECQDTFKLLMRELEDRFNPVDEVELGFIEEMAACYWRMRRGWTIEAELLNEGLHQQRPANYNARLAAAFTGPDMLPKLTLLQRYESRLHRMYQRALNNLLELRRQKQEEQMTEEPNPISEHAPEPQPAQTELLSSVLTHERSIPVPVRPARSTPAAPSPVRNSEENPAA